MVLGSISFVLFFVGLVIYRVSIPVIVERLKRIGMEKEVLVKVEGLSKKFCKDLKTSLWYGVKDLVSRLLVIKEMKRKT